MSPAVSARCACCKPTRIDFVPVQAGLRFSPRSPMRASLALRRLGRSADGGFHAKLQAGWLVGPSFCRARWHFRLQRTQRSSGHRLRASIRRGIAAPLPIATAPLPIIRGFSFAAPAGSTAQVTFHGSILCAVSPVVPTAKRVVDIVGQIVPTSAAAANHNGRGGLRYNVTLDEFAGTIRGSDTFNLASTA